MNEKPKNIDEYIADFPVETRVKMEELRACIQAAAPDAEECISYAIPTFRQNGNLVHFAAYKHHIGFYPGAAMMKQYDKQFSKYKRATGSVQFPLDQPLPLKLVAEITKIRVKQNLEKAKGKRKK